MANCESLDAVIREFMSTKTQVNALRFFDEAGSTVGPVFDISNTTQHPYVKARGIITRVPDDEVGEVAMHAVVPRFFRNAGIHQDASAETRSTQRRVSGASDSDTAREQEGMSMLPPLPVWRSMMFVPAHVERFVTKAQSCGADAIILDLEDSVPSAEKINARNSLIKTVRDFPASGPDIIVRINRPWRLCMAIARR